MTISTLMEKIVVHVIISIIPKEKNANPKATNTFIISIGNAILKTISTLMGRIVTPKTIITTLMMRNVNLLVVQNTITITLLIVNLTADNAITILYIIIGNATQKIINIVTVKTATLRIIAITVMRKYVILCKNTSFIISTSTNMRNTTILMEKLLKKNIMEKNTKRSLNVSTKNIPSMNILTVTLLIPTCRNQRRKEERVIKSISIPMVIPLTKE